MMSFHVFYSSVDSWLDVKDLLPHAVLLANGSGASVTDIHSRVAAICVLLTIGLLIEKKKFV